MLDDIALEVVHDIDSIMPSVYKIGASTKKGYCVLEVTAYSEDSALKIGVKDFDSQFGGIYDNKILGFQRGANICKNKHRVYNISLETQFKICEIMRWGYVEYFENYSKYIRSIIYAIDSEVEVSDDMIKLMFVNKVAKKSGKCKDVNLDVLGFELENFINILVTSSKDELEKMLLMERNNLSKRK